MATNVHDLTHQLSTSLLFQRFEEALVGLDSDGRVVLWNPAAERLFGYAAHEIVGRWLAQLCPGGSSAGALYRQLAQDAGSAQCLTVPLRRNTGETFLAEWTLTTLDPQASLTVACIRDVTRSHQQIAALEASRNTLEALIDAAPVSILTCDLEGRITRWNPSAEETFGWSAAEVMGRPVPFVPSESAAEFRSLLERTRQGEVSSGWERRRRRKDGQPLDICLSLAPLADEHGSIQGVLAVAVDMTERNRIEAALARTNAVLAAEQEASLDAVLVIDEHRRVATYNHQFKALWGIPDHVLATRDDQALLDWVRPQLADWDAFLAGIQRLYAEPGTVHGDDIALRDGRILERYSAPAQGEHGEFLGRVWFFRDVTERARLMEALRESEVRFRTLFEGSGVGIDIVDLQGHLMECNQALERMLGYPRDQLLGQTFAAYTHPDDRASSVSKFRQLAAGNCDFYRLEKRYLRPDGRIVWANLHVFMIRDAQGHPRCAMAIVEDITERKRLEETLQEQYRQLRELDELKSHFVNAVSHDLRTPLTSILGYTEFLEDQVGGPLSEEQRGFVDQIHKSTLRLEGMVQDLLDFARLEAGTFELHCECSDFRAMAHEVALSLQPQIEAAQLRFESQLPDAPVPLSMDRERLERVLMNLIGNALKFTPPGGSVTLRVTATPDELRCEVEDTGVGIAPEDQPRLFRPFSQLATGRRTRGGTGLGLNISKALVEAHGGRIGVDSALEAGSTFWFTLPRTPC